MLVLTAFLVFHSTMMVVYGLTVAFDAMASGGRTPVASNLLSAASVWLTWFAMVWLPLQAGPLREYSPEYLDALLEDGRGVAVRMPLAGPSPIPSGDDEPTKLAATSGILRTAREARLETDSLVATRSGRTTTIPLANVAEVQLVREDRRAGLNVRDADGNEIRAHVILRAADPARAAAMESFDTFARRLHARLGPRWDQILFTAGCLTSPVRAVGIAAGLGAWIGVGFGVAFWNIGLWISLPLAVILVTTGIATLVRWGQTTAAAMLREYRPSALDEVLDPKADRARFPRW